MFIYTQSIFYIRQSPLNNAIITARGQNQAQKPLPKNKADKKRTAKTIKLPDIIPSEAPMIISSFKFKQHQNLI